jgi:mRNA interferase HigB
VRIISIKRIQEESERIGDAGLAKDLGAWMQVIRSGEWKNFNELRQSIPSADVVDGMVVFNIRHNRFRLIVRVIYVTWSKSYRDWTKGQVLVGGVLTHAEYDRWNKLSAKKKRGQIWPPR